MSEITTQEAFKVIKQTMIDDSPSEPGSYAHAWHCNIAMMCFDAINEELDNYQITPAMGHSVVHKISNDAASRFMKICFDVDTKN